MALGIGNKKLGFWQTVGSGTQRPTNLRCGNGIQCWGLWFAVATADIHVHPLVSWFLGFDISNQWSSSWIPPVFLHWVVVDLPLWKIWVRQLGWLHSQYMGKYSSCSSHHQPDNIWINLHFLWFSYGVPMVFLWFATGQATDSGNLRDLSWCFAPSSTRQAEGA